MSREMLHFQLRFLKINVALFSLVLLGNTWKLWTPQRLFPQVPLFGWISAVPAESDWFTFATLLAAAVCLLVLALTPFFLRITDRELLPLFQQVCGGLFLSAFLLSIVFDQHRIQPWAYQFALGFLILTFLKPPRAIQLFRLFVISIYLYSALSKCDASFVQTLGQQLVEGLCSAIGISTVFWSKQTLNWIAASFPAGEFLIGLGLFFQRTRQLTLWAAVGMHVCLMLAIGPRGLNHYQGVLIWNVYFIIQDLILFGLLSKGKLVGSVAAGDLDRSLSLKVVSGFERVALVIVWLAMLAPLLEPTGYFDHWPAWGLYASHHDRVILLIDEEAKSKLPPALQPFVDPPRPLSRWCRVRVERWSLAELGAPIYPQARFQLGVAIAVGKSLEQETENREKQPQIKLLFEGAAHRLTGKRKISEYSGLKQIELLTNRFWLNAEPRPFAGNDKSNLFH
ncbi:hypothetical protein [uncultured Gimesia sp.]|jgi:hypothetical protein|uniref:hypothetical protein n=1 Tax=uncultured Gimesia sp. TaxID=1678688 RepID=UPI0026279E91|nr:hypothetical protein [uncultured Gimesia sp.]